MDTPAREYVKDHPELTDALYQERKLARIILNAYLCDPYVLDENVLADVGITQKYDPDYYDVEPWYIYKGEIL
jgi:hypothetical protein